jgi:hypothetical protein
MIPVMALAAPPQKAVLDHVVAHRTFEARPLDEVVALLTEASGVQVKLSGDVQRCVAAGKCDWRLYGEWTGQTLAQALDTLVGSTDLAFHLDGKTVVITRKSAK